MFICYCLLSKYVLNSSFTIDVNVYYFDIPKHVMKNVAILRVAFIVNKSTLCRFAPKLWGGKIKSWRNSPNFYKFWLNKEMLVNITSQILNDHVFFGGVRIFDLEIGQRECFNRFWISENILILKAMTWNFNYILFEVYFIMKFTRHTERMKL